MSRTNRHSWSIYLDFACLCVLVVCAIKLTVGLEKVYDLSLQDESYLMWEGVSPLKPYVRESAGWGILYCWWYRFLHLLVSDRVRLFFLNTKLLSAMLPACVFVFLRDLRVSRQTALLTCFLFLISQGNVPVYPKIIHFALCPLLLAWVCGRRMNLKEAPFFMVGFAALVASYARPEISLTAYLACASLWGWLAILAIGRKASLQSTGISAGLALMLSAAIVLAHFFLGNPMSDGDRSWGAFGPLFAIHWVQWNSSPLSPWTRWPEMLPKVFPNAHSYSSAILENPLAVLRHVIDCFWDFAHDFPGILFGHFSIFFPSRWKIPATLEVGIWAAGFFFVVFAYRASWRKFLTGLSERLDGPSGLALLLVFLPFVLSCSLFYPRQHYMVPIALFVFILFSLFVDEVLPLHRQRTAVVAAAIFALTPCVNSAWTTGLTHGQRALETVELLRSIPFDPSRKKITLLEADGGYQIYLDDRFTRVKGEYKDKSMARILAEDNLDVVIVSDLMSKDPAFTQDASYQAFIAQPFRFGFREFAKLYDKRILVRTDSVRSLASQEPVSLQK